MTTERIFSIDDVWAMVRRRDAELDEARACLEWALRFAVGSRDADASLDNPIFNEWITRSWYAADCPPSR